MMPLALADIGEDTIRMLLPGYVEGSFASDSDNGVYSGRMKLGDGSERTIAYAPNPSGGWDCTVIAPRRGEFYIFRTMFAQTRKPYQDKALIRNSVGLAGRGNAAGSLIRGLLTSFRDISQTGSRIPQSGAPAQGGRYSLAPNPTTQPPSTYHIDHRTRSSPLRLRGGCEVLVASRVHFSR